MTLYVDGVTRRKILDLRNKLEKAGLAKEGAPDLCALWQIQIKMTLWTFLIIVVGNKVKFNRERGVSKQ